SAVFAPGHDLLAVDGVGVGLAGSLGADQRFGNAGDAGEVPVAIANLPAHAQHVYALGVFVFDGEEVVDVAIDVWVVAGAQSAAHPQGPGRVLSERPIDHVEIVHVLLDDVIAAGPNEVVPVMEDVAEVGGLFAMADQFTPTTEPNRPLVPV